MKTLFTVILIPFICFNLFAQVNFYAIGTTWDDSFKEWNIDLSDEELEGVLEKRWPSNEDWSVWDYRIEDEIGAIKQKFVNNSNHWELRGDNQIVTMKTKWINDIREWRITTKDISLTLKTKYTTNMEEWTVEGVNYGRFEMYTSYENDSRDWEIIDELDENVSLPMKMALVFIVMYNSTPKF